MSKEEVAACFCSLSPKRKKEFRVAMQCAPVLKGIKAANLVTARPGNWRFVRQELTGCRVICALIYADAGKEVLFLYRYGLLEQHLKNRQVRAFLEGYGYQATDVAGVLKRLGRRYQRYVGLGEEFPHELGVILGYPVADVEGFIANRGRNSLMSGYWKVYQNREYARQVFQSYDEAREAVARELLEGYSLAATALP